MKVPDVERNLVPDTWTADADGALPELGSCPHDNSCVGCRGTELSYVKGERLMTVGWIGVRSINIKHILERTYFYIYISTPLPGAF